jgi:CPA2 family monovalent cation:H+ antiporter-2
VNPWLFKSMLALEPWLKTKPRVMAVINRRVEALGRGANAAEAARIAAKAVERVIIVGYGPVGRTVSRRAQEFGLEAVVIDLNIDTVLALQAEGKRSLYGDATHADILREAGIVHAPYLVISVPDPVAGLAVLTAARELNPRIKVLARVRYLAEGGALEQAGADAVCYDEAEAATALGVVLRAHLKAGAASA